MKNHASVLFVLGLFVLSDAINADPLGSFEDVMRGHGGVAALVARDNVVLYEAGHGENVRTGSVLTPDTPFMIGSVSKPITAILVLRQVESGLVELDDSIAKHLFEFSCTPGESITIRDLLWHTSGLPHYEGFLSFGYTRESFNASALPPDTLVAMIAGMQLRSDPGTRFHFSSPGYMLLGAILERTTGESFGEILKREITEPLDLHSTGYSNLGIIPSGVPPDVRFRESPLGAKILSRRKGRWDEVPDRNLTNAYAAAGVMSSVADLWRITLALREGELLSSDMIDAMFRPHQFGYSFGWFRNPEELLQKNRNVRLSAHSGQFGEYRAFWGVYDDGTTIIVLATSNQAQPIELVHEMYMAAHDL